MPRLVYLAVAALLASTPSAISEPLFPNSVASNDLDFIRDDDPEVGFCLRYAGTSRAEMPDNRHDGLFADDVHVFQAAFADNATVALWVHPDVGTRADAEDLIEPVLHAVAKLPRPMRALLDHVVLHSGNETAFSEDLGRFFVLYSENVRSRIATHDLEETVFHESVHATLDVPHASSAAWRAAQQFDGDLITVCAVSAPLISPVSSR